MPLALVALLIAGELVSTAPPEMPASSATAPAPPPPASAPKGVVGVDLPAFPSPAKSQRVRDRLAPAAGDQPSQQPGFEFGDPFRQRTPPSASSPGPSEPEASRCRRKQTANGFIYSCGDPEAAREREEEAERLLNDLMSPR